tara:strand:+ start:611 stop:1486 length:876 start_codon:yes stop_codon:yes gene_type:complete
MPGSNYVRFSDNSSTSNNSYRVFNDNQQEVVEQFKQTPQQLQRQQEQFQQQIQSSPSSPSQSHSPTQQQIHSQNPLPNFDDETRNKQLELRQKQQQLQQERYQSSIPQSKETGVNIEPVVEDYSRLSVSDIHHRFPNTNEIYVNEIHRLLQAENSLTLEQASNLAQVNGCGVDGYSDMCPSRPVETFRQRGDCVGEGCDVTFNTQKERFEKSIGDKLSELGITFYTNTGCGFCQQTHNLINKHGGNLKDNIVISNKLPSGARGFPHFVSSVTGKSHTGFPGTLERMYDLLS